MNRKTKNKSVIISASFVLALIIPLVPMMMVSSLPELDLTQIKANSPETAGPNGADPWEENDYWNYPTRLSLQWEWVHEKYGILPSAENAEGDWYLFSSYGYAKVALHLYSVHGDVLGFDIWEVKQTRYSTGMWWWKKWHIPEYNWQNPNCNKIGIDYDVTNEVFNFQKTNSGYCYILVCIWRVYKQNPEASLYSFALGQY